MYLEQQINGVKMKVYRLNTGVLGVNTYILQNEKKRECIVIDPGGDFNMIMDSIKKLNSKPIAVLLTHGHFDHIGAVPDFQNLGIEVYVHFADDGLMVNPRSNDFPQLSKFTRSCKADKYVQDRDVLKLAGMKVEVITTPGHTRGSICYKVENNIFTGDSLFRGSVGRADMEGGDYNTLIYSIKHKLLRYHECLVYPGHDEMTDIDVERDTNPYLQGE